MEVGDLIKIFDCPPVPFQPGRPCPCVWCASKSSRIGIVTERDHSAEDFYSTVLFDFGPWLVWDYMFGDGRAEVLCECG